MKYGPILKLRNKFCILDFLSLTTFAFWHLARSRSAVFWLDSKKRLLFSYKHQCSQAGAALLVLVHSSACVTLQYLATDWEITISSVYLKFRDTHPWALDLPAPAPAASSTHEREYTVSACSTCAQRSFSCSSRDSEHCCSSRINVSDNDSVGRCVRLLHEAACSVAAVVHATSAAPGSMCSASAVAPSVASVAPVVLVALVSESLDVRPLTLSFCAPVQSTVFACGCVRDFDFDFLGAPGDVNLGLGLPKRSAATMRFSANAATMSAAPSQS